MAAKDPYEELCRYYEFALGPLLWRDEFKAHMREAITPEDLRIYLLLPFMGKATWDKLRKKAGLPDEDLRAVLRGLAAGGFILAFQGRDEPIYERGNLGFMTEQQVRTLPDCPRRVFFARMMNAFIGGAIGDLPTRTPYYRVLPVESTVTQQGDVRRIEIDAPVPDPRGVLPIDVVSSMIKNETHLIGVAQCYCRRARDILHKGCDHPTETCLVFDELADTLINAGIARQIDYAETMAILRLCEESGLVHNVDNCESKIHSICNCCSCCCVVVNTMALGFTNTGRSSRYVVRYDPARCVQCRTCIARCPTRCRVVENGHLAVDTGACLGCGLCVTACRQGANQMAQRQEQTSTPATLSALYRQISREAVVGLVKRRILGR